MKSLIANYALEGNTDGKPNGHFYMTKTQTESAAEEVLNTHLDFTGLGLKYLLEKTMNNLWPQYDVQNEGYIEVERAAVFLRQALGNAETAFGLN